MNILVTGGAGFVGSNLIDRLLAEGHDVVCVDDLSLGRLFNIERHLCDERFTFVQSNIADYGAIRHIFTEYAIETIFHLAANSDIRRSAESPGEDLSRTLLTTFSVLEGMRESKARQIIFSSSSAIYGEHDGALREESGPLFPLSHYGAAKLGSEGFISSYGENYGIRSWIVRFPNVVGPRMTHGVLYDFLHRLQENPECLAILGDGSQTKPYLHVADLIEAMLFVWKHADGKRSCFNVGTESATSVTQIAQIACEERGLKNTIFNYSGGKRGWTGDVPCFRYDLSHIHALGWRASMNSDDAVRRAARELLAEEAAER